jgi:hypothetical protein
MNKIASLSLAVWALGTSAYANDASFNEAVNLYLKGYADCREANTLRTDDIATARKFFDNYLKILDQAAAIDPSILQSTERDMDANITYCERVNDNLKMAEAAPVLEAGFASCETAKTALANHELDAARQAMDVYGIKRDEALAITPNIMDVFSLASQVRACGRLQEKLTEATQASEADAKAVASLEQQINRYQQQCQTALAYTRKSSFTVDTIDQANRLLAEAQLTRKQAAGNAAARAALKQDPARSDALKQIEDAAGRCEVEVSGVVRNMTKQRQLAEATLEEAIARLGKASGQCRQGLQGLASGNTPRADAQKLFAQINSLVADANTPALSALAKRHPDWSQSLAWQKQSAEVRQCQQQLETAQAKAPAPVATANRNAASTAKTRPDAAATPAPRVEAPTAIVSTPDTEKRDPTATVATQEPPAKAAENLPGEAPAAGDPDNIRVGNGDWTELADEPVDTEEAPASNKKALRKSWTDLVH